MSLIRTRHTWLLLAILGGFVALLGPTLSNISLVPHLWPRWVAALPWLVYIALAYGAAKYYERVWSLREGNVTADEHGLYLEGRQVLRRSAVRHGHIMREGDRVFLRLHRRAPFAAPYDVEVESENEARRLLADLRLDAQTSVSEFELRWGTERGAKVRQWISSSGTALALAVSVALFSGRGDENLLMGSWMACMMVAMYSMVSRVTEVSVGADGVRVRRVVRRERFLSYGDIREVRLDGKDLYLELTDGTSITLHQGDQGATLEQRIRDALAIHRARNVSAAATVNRGGRSTADWLSATKDRRANYREAVVPDEELWTIVEDAAASPTERAGAALALRKELDESGRTRLRIAAGACAEKKLRVALESVAERVDDEELAEVLEPLEDRRHFGTKSTSTLS